MRRLAKAVLARRRIKRNFANSSTQFDSVASPPGRLGGGSSEGLPEVRFAGPTGSRTGRCCTSCTGGASLTILGPNGSAGGGSTSLVGPVESSDLGVGPCGTYGGREPRRGVFDSAG